MSYSRINTHIGSGAEGEGGAGGGGSSAVLEYDLKQIAEAADTIVSGSAGVNNTNENNFTTTAAISGNTLSVNDVVFIQAVAKVRNNNGGSGDLTCRINLEGTEIAKALPHVPVTDDVILLQASGIVTAVGASGAIKITSVSISDSPSRTGLAAGSQSNIINTASVAVDTTADISVGASAQWSVKSNFKQCDLRSISAQVLAG
tara:strand:- start:191 stop:799 length:609 start_codon:yes stop_codon:yes gene_type:complete